MFNLLKKLFGKKAEAKRSKTWAPRIIKRKEVFGDAGMSIRRQKRKAKSRKRDRIAKKSRKINRAA